MMKSGQQGGLTVRLEGLLCHPLPLSRGGPVSRHQKARGALTTHPFPGACAPTSPHPHTGAVVSVCGKWRLRSGRALSPSGPLPPPSAMEAPEVLWQWRGATDGGFIVASPGHLDSLHSQCRRGPTGWRRWCPPPLRAVPDGCGHIFRRGSNGWRHWRPSPLRAQAQVFPPAQRMAPLGHVCHQLPPPVLAAIFVARGPYIGTHLHVCTFMTSKLHDTMRGRPISPLSSLPFFAPASSPPVGPCWSLPFCGCRCPALRVVYLFFSLPLFVSPLSRSAPGTLHDTVLDSFSLLRDRLDRGRACRPAAAFPQPPTLHLYEPAPGAPPMFVGSGQRHCAQVTCHAALPLAPPLPLSLSPPWSALCLPLGPSLVALPLTRMLHNNVQGTLPSSCPGPSCRCAHGAWQPSVLPGPSVGGLVASSMPLSRPLYFSPLHWPVLSLPFSSCSALPPLSVPLRPLSMMHDTYLFSNTSGHTLLLAHCTPLLPLLFVPVARGQGRQEPVHPSLVRRSLLPRAGSGQRHGAHDARHVAQQSPLWPLYPPPLSFSGRLPFV